MESLIWRFCTILKVFPCILTVSLKEVALMSGPHQLMGRPASPTHRCAPGQGPPSSPHHPIGCILATFVIPRAQNQVAANPSLHEGTPGRQCFQVSPKLQVTRREALPDCSWVVCIKLPITRSNTTPTFFHSSRVWFLPPPPPKLFNSKRWFYVSQQAMPF